MHRHCSAALCLILAVAGLQMVPATLWAATPPPPRDRQDVERILAAAPKTPPGPLRPLKIVLVANRKDHGPHEHDYPLWMERWKTLLGGTGAGAGPVNLYGPAADTSKGPAPGAAGVTVETAKDWPSAEQFARADLVVAFFGTGGIWNQAKLRDVKALLERGGGLVAVHSAVIAEAPNAKPLAESIGLAWEGGYTRFRVGPVDLKIVAPEHPICRGLPERIHFEDETYWPLVGDASRIGLLATADEKAKDTGRLHPEPMFWTHEAGKGRAFGCIFGHSTWTFDDPFFRILLLRGMAWAAREWPYRFDSLVLCGARTSDQKRISATMPAGVQPVAPDPNDPNLVLWLDASDKATVSTGPDGRVAGWANKGKTVGRTLASANAHQPLYVPKAMGGLPAVRFDGVDDALRDVAFKQSAAAWTVAMVVAPQSNAGNGQFHALMATNRPGHNDFLTGLNLDLGPGETPEFSVLNLEGIKDVPGATNLRTDSAPFGEGQIILVSTGSTRSRLWINGAEEEGRAANDAVTAMDDLRVGARFFQNQEHGYLHGDISEVILYRTELSDAGRAGLYAYLVKRYGADLKRGAAYTLERVWDYLPSYDWGSPRRALEPIDEALRSAGADSQARRMLESRLLDVVKGPSATAAAKDYACRRLAIVGSAASVAALATLLSDERLADVACFALERIPDSAADDVLRRALPTTSGKARIAVVNALGSRRSQASVAELARLLAGSDDALAEAAAAALGKIGGAPAAEALRSVLGKHAGPARATVLDSCLNCADQFRRARKHAEALRLYDTLRSGDVPETTRIAAARGIILIRGAAAAPLLLEYLKSDRPQSQTMALVLVRQMPGKEVTVAIASQLGCLPPDSQARTIAALADRGDPAACPMLLAALNRGPSAVRLAAVRALGHLADASVVAVLLAVAANGEREVAEAAEISLSLLSDRNVDAAVLDAMTRGDDKTRLAAIHVLGRRRFAPAAKSLLTHARGPNPTLRLAAIRALGECAGAGDLGALVDMLVEAREPPETAALEAAVTAIGARVEPRDACASLVAARFAGADSRGKQALLHVLSRVGGPAAVAPVRAAVADPDAAVRDAALRTLCDWPDAQPADDLLKIVQQSGNERHRRLALRGYLRMAGLAELPQQRRLAMAAEGLRRADRDDERRLALGVLAGVPSAEALSLVLPCLGVESLREEAGAAAVAIAEKLPPNQSGAVIEAMDKVLKTISGQDLVRRAKELQTKARQSRS